MPPQELMRELQHMGSRSGVSAAFQGFIEGLGFSCAVCLRLPCGGRTPADRILMSSAPAAWLDGYLARHLLEDDPPVEEAGRVGLPFAWSDGLPDRHLTAGQRAVLSWACNFGMSAGFVVPIHESGEPAAVVSILGRDVAFDETMRSALTLAAIYLYNRLVVLLRRERQPELSRREIECLIWVAAGKSDRDIGTILGISPKTVNYHVENAKRKLGASSRIQAVMAAHQRGLIRA